jgi:hypothetical protein
VPFTERESRQQSLLASRHPCKRHGRLAPSRALDIRSVACAESRSLRPDRWDWVEIREYLVLTYDGKTERFPVLDGDAAQARLRASLVQRPNDCVIAVTEDAYIRVRPGLLEERRSPTTV